VVIAGSEFTMFTSEEAAEAGLTLEEAQAAGTGE